MDFNKDYTRHSNSRLSLMTKQHNIDKTSLEMIHQIKITVKTNMDHMNEQHGYSQSSMGNTSLWIGPSNEEISHEIFS